MAFVALTSAETDAKSPIDDSLMGKIKDDFDDLDSRVVAASSQPIYLDVGGRLAHISTQRRAIGMAFVKAAFVPTQARWLLRKSGTGGTLGFDIRKHTATLTPITSILAQYSASTSSIAQTGSSLATQSIARNASQIATQSITLPKAANNVQSIILLGSIDGTATNLVQYNLASAISADTFVGDSIVFASCTTGANNGTFVIVDIGRGGGNNVVVTNVSGVAQTGVAGTAQEMIISYNFTNPVDTVNFAAGFSHTFASHTTGANNGTLLVYAVNMSGNNLWVKNATGVAQAGVAGTVDTNFWKFAFTLAVLTTDYIVGEFAKTAAHTTGANNVGALKIIAVNSGGNNVVLYNSAGVAQAGVAGNVNTNRWTYALPSDPSSSSNVAAGDTVFLSSHTNALNNGTFTVKEVNHLAANSIVVYNESGVAQGGAVGTTATTRKLVSFAADQSAIYSTSSFIEMKNTPDEVYSYHYNRAPYQVLQVNRGGGSNYNVVIDAPTGSQQQSPAGYVQVEMKSIFTVAPTLAVSVTGLEPNQNLVGSSTSLSGTTIAAQTPLALYFTSMMTGDPKDFSFSIL